VTTPILIFLGRRSIIGYNKRELVDNSRVCRVGSASWGEVVGDYLLSVGEQHGKGEQPTIIYCEEPRAGPKSAVQPHFLTYF
jgi:hypothetical protein